MPVAIFKNRRAHAFNFVLEPNDERYIVPLLAKIGVRYSFESGADDRIFTSYGNDVIYFWCDTTHREVQIIHPTAFDQLLWDVCTNLGFCGGIVNGKPTRVTDLLPTTGIVTAEDFASLVLQAECGKPSPQAMRNRWEVALASKFCEHMGARSVATETLVLNLSNPFD